MCSCPEISPENMRKWYYSEEVWQENERNADIKIVFRNDCSVWHCLWITHTFRKAHNDFQMRVHDPEDEGSRFWAHMLEDSDLELAGFHS